MEEKVSSFVRNDGNWNSALLHHLLIEEVVEYIIDIHPFMPMAGIDSTTLAMETSTVFTMKTAYALLQGDTWAPNDLTWSKIWSWEGAT
ncbi:hypothetical protein Ancab_035713, partial [Ancistrocladus abbreviatus]